jgi:alpha-beta hydrolase superfamily lysophospholipase
MTLKPHIIYLHGLGSGPRSQKGVLVRDHFSALGCSVSLPSITVPNLERLSPLDAIKLVQSEIAARGASPLVVMGSSFGAFVAVHAVNGMGAGERGHLRRMVLLAPVFNPWDASSGLLTPERERVWRERGVAPVLDLESGQEVPVHYRFVEELRAFDSTSLVMPVPTLIIHGTRDEVVPVSQSKEFAAGRPDVALELVDDSHQLLKAPEKMLESIERFILSDSTTPH